MARIFFSAAHKSSGKTTVTTGFAAALAARGLDVRPFKKGPDYIDPMWLGNASGKPCYNLDFHMQETAEIDALFHAKAAGGDIAIIEGNKGLHDGMDLEGADSNAQLAKQLQAPVVLVVDARGMTRGAAPLVLGNATFDKQVNVVGVVLNFVGGPRHEAKLRAVIERYTDIPVLGAVHRDPAIALTERHLGLIPSNEIPEARALIERIGLAMAEQIDLDRIIELAKTAPALPPACAAAPMAAPDVTIAVARGPAFGFYYADDIEAMERAGAELVFFDPESATRLPKADGLLIGGGFPEARMKELAANTDLLGEIRSAIAGGLPAYAECGGMMVLARSISWNGERAAMAGVVAGDIVMNERPQGRGYIVVAPTGQHPWQGALAGMDAIPAHEFHYSRLENLEGEHTFSYDVTRGQCIGGRDGLVINNLLAGYAHMRHTSRSPWADDFIAFVRAHKNAQQP